MCFMSGLFVISEEAILYAATRGSKKSTLSISNGVAMKSIPYKLAYSANSSNYAKNQLSNTFCLLHTPVG